MKRWLKNRQTVRYKIFETSGRIWCGVYSTPKKVINEKIAVDAENIKYEKKCQSV